jgi:hypothetical protein
MKLVLVHGRAQQHKDKVKLQKEWQDSLEMGLAKSSLTWITSVSVVFPFYGDELDRLVTEIDAPLLDEVHARGAEPDLGELAFKAEFLREAMDAKKIQPATIRDTTTVPVKERGVLNWRWVQAVLRVLDPTPAGDASLDRVTRDVYVYLTYPAVRKAIDKIVADALPNDGPCVVVAHSLGTIVAYNVLRNAPASLGVPAYITVGSPLGVKAVKKRLDVPLTRPKCANRWYNAMDPRDVVALYPLDHENFPITPLIVNKIDVDNFTDNRHGIIGYLSDADVAKAIYISLK